MVDILITNAEVLTMNPKEPRIVEGAVAIEGDRIVAVGENGAIKRKYHGDMTIDARQKVVMPGLINAHDHFEQSFMKGFVRLYPGSTSEWIREFKIPLTREMGPEDYYYSNLIACLEMIRSGITCGVNSVCQQDPKRLRSFGLEKSIEAASETGVRELMAVSAADKTEPPDFLLSPDEAVTFVDWAVKKWNHAEKDRIRVWTGLAGVFSCTPKLWSSMKSLAEERGVGLHTHIASSATGEVEEAYANNNLGPMITGAHCVWLSEREIDIMSKTGVKAVHCPTYKLSYSIDSNCSGFGAGIAPISEMVEHGIVTGLGTDGCMGDTRDLFREMRNLAFTQHYRTRDKHLFPPPKLLQMATIDAAVTLNWQDEIGSLEPGKKADVILIDRSKEKMVPWTNPAASLVYLTDGPDVNTVIINGRIVMEDRKMAHVDENEVMTNAQDAAMGLMQRAGFESFTTKGVSPWDSTQRL